MCVCVYVCVNYYDVCMYVCMYVCLYVCMCVCISTGADSYQRFDYYQKYVFMYTYYIQTEWPGKDCGWECSDQGSCSTCSHPLFKEKEIVLTTLVWLKFWEGRHPNAKYHHCLYADFLVPPSDSSDNWSDCQFHSWVVLPTWSAQAVEVKSSSNQSTILPAW